MPKDSFEHLETDRRLQGNPLASHLAPFATSLLENGYVKSIDRTVETEFAGEFWPVVGATTIINHRFRRAAR